MRLATIASALAIVVCAAVFGAILFQRRPFWAAVVPSVEGQASGTVVTTVKSVAVQASAANRAPTVVAQASPPKAGR